MEKENPDLIYPELSYQIIGISFKIFNKLGYGFQEKYYQRVFSKEFDIIGLKYEKEKVIDIKYDNKFLGRYLLDFVVDNKIVVELKVRPRLGYVDIKQTLNYLKTGQYKLALIIYFTKEGIKYRRIVNSYII